MKSTKMPLQILFSIAFVFSLILPASIAGASVTVPWPDDCSISHSVVDGSSASFLMVLNTPQGNVTPMVAAGFHYTVGLKSDGTVVAVGDNEYGQRDVNDWTDITQIAAGDCHTVGLKTDGTLVAAGDNWDGKCEIGNWTDITQVAAGGDHTVGLKTDGTVLAVGTNYPSGQCDVSNWTDVIQVTAGFSHTVGLKSDGTVVAVGYNYSGQCNVGNWTDVIQITAGRSHTVGLKSDGMVVAVGRSLEGQCDVGGWTDITQVAADGYHTVGLKEDGTVVAAGNNYSGQCDIGGWTNITQVAAGNFQTVGLEDDGIVVAVGSNDYGQCEVGDWNLVLALPPPQRVLTISRTAGGSVTTPGEGAFSYDEGTAVNLVAEAEENYEFVEWTGDVDNIADVNAALTTITIDDSYSITANFELEEGLCSLNISSTTGGSVANPGEGTFIYDEGAVVDLVVAVEEGHRFVNWTGDVDTISDVNITATNITMDDNYAITANIEYESQEAQVGIKAGDWIQVEYTITGWPAGQPYPEWLKLEFLSVEGTIATVLVTLHMSDGTEQSDTVPTDVVSGGEVPGLSGGIIPPNLTTGDSLYITGYGSIVIEGETTRTYTGARRGVVYAGFSQDGVQLKYYWDKQTGVMVEATTTWEDITATAKVIETNMWEAAPPIAGTVWWLWVIVAVVVVAVVLVIFFMRRRRVNRTEGH